MATPRRKPSRVRLAPASRLAPGPPGPLREGSPREELGGACAEASGAREPRENEKCHDSGDHKQKVETIVKNLKTISREVRRMKEHAQVLLCDLTMQLDQPSKTKHVKEAKKTNNAD